MRVRILRLYCMRVALTENVEVDRREEAVIGA
jgi:hypothetical protein